MKRARFDVGVQIHRPRRRGRATVQGRCVAPAGKESGDYFGAKWVNWVWARKEDARQEEGGSSRVG